MEGRFLYFEKFRLDVRSGELFKEGRPVRLPPQPTKLLLLLARSPGALVSHEEIQKELWGEDTFVDFEQAVKKCVKQVRAALGDDAEEPLYVETVPRRGYRFVGPLRVDGGEVSPYPGLSTFSEKDARFFFGREGEAEALWNKIGRRRLLGLIGPSGVGKSSFLRAGLLPSRPEGWRPVFGTPGNSPMTAIERGGGGGPTLVVVDAFEELFTRNPLAVQKEFSEHLGALAREKDVHVLLSMRDDFLFRCHEQESLQEVFFDLTPLGPPTGEALRRALVEPAASCGYRFEEGLVEDMLLEVEKLPLLAFAAAELWEKRDRERKVLTRAAYEEIGRVGGALAQHAERTLQSIGAERQSTVREIFRNLTTSQGTKVAMGKEELLSVFPERERAEGVLANLIDARLLTSSANEVEIIHESLLSAWPRLVQWQAQDAEGTVLRDQLRQAARLWEDRGHTDDLLWSGAAFRDFMIWRERYPGGLTETEEEFAEAATRLAGWRRRRRRIALAASFAVLLGVVGVVTSLWRRSVLEVSRREAAQILALGRLELEDRPTAALAHALASLERADSDEARRFGVEALWHGAPAYLLRDTVHGLDFSPDGRWLATDGIRSGGVRLWSMEGGSPKTLGEPDGIPSVAFGPTGEFLALGGEETVRFWSLREGKELRNVKLAGRTSFLRTRSHLWSLTRTAERMRALRDWSAPEEVPGILASLDFGEVTDWDIDASGDWLVTARENGVYLDSLQDSSPERERLLGKHQAKVVWVAAHPTASRFVSGDEEGEVRMWSFSDTAPHLERTFRALGGMARLDPTDSWMVVSPSGKQSTRDVAYLWGLTDPPDAEPFVLRNGDSTWLNWAVFDPQGLWLVTANSEFGILWPLPSKRSLVLRGQSPPFIAIAFTPDGSGLVSTSEEGAVRLWPLSSLKGERSRILMTDKTARLGFNIDVDRAGKHVLVGSRFDPRVFLVPLDGGPALLMPGFTPAKGFAHPLGFSLDGRFAAAAGSRPAMLRIWDLETGKLRMLDLHAPEECAWGNDWEGYVSGLEFLPEGRLLTVGVGGVRVWDLERASSERIRGCSPAYKRTFLAADDRRARFLVLEIDDSTRVSTLSWFDLETRTFHEITSHGNRVFAAGLDPTGKIVVTGDLDGVVRVGPIAGDEPHLLFGHELEVSSVAFSPDGRWIASGSQDGTIRLWPMPEGPPFHTLPYEEILERIRALTNLRLVPDDASGTGYRIEVGSFPGWKTLPSW